MQKETVNVRTRYRNVFEDFVSQKLDGAFFGSLTYVLAHEETGVETVASPEAPGGLSSRI